LGSDDEHLSFVVAACARPIMPGDKTSQAAVAFDDFRNARRLTDTVFIRFPPRAFCYAAIGLRPFAYR
jgi:hypothetical protein